MQDKALYEQLLGIGKPWHVQDVDLQLADGRVEILVAISSDSQLCCPECGKPSPGYDTRRRRWRHLDTMQYRTELLADVPRVRCASHGVHQIEVPWAEDGSRFTAMFEALVIDWLAEASFAAVARQLSLSWDQVAGIQDRAVQRGLLRRRLDPLHQIGVDETSFQKRHEYVTIVCDLERDRVVYVADDHKQSSLQGFYEALGEDGIASLEAIAMDMWSPYIRATRECVPDADSKIVFDKFHVAKLLNDAVDKVRRQENRQLLGLGDERLKGSKYLWLKKRYNIHPRRRREFAALRRSELKVARAWAIKETAMQLWGYQRRAWAERMWRRWYNWAIRSQLASIKYAARRIKRHFYGVINAATSSVTNARCEGMNSKIQWIKRKACGYRNRKRFRNAIYFHLGRLDMYPSSLHATHTNA